MLTNIHDIWQKYTAKNLKRITSYCTTNMLRVFTLPCGKKTNWKDVGLLTMTTSVNSRRPSVHKRPVTPLFGHGFSAITSLFFRRKSKRIAFLESVNFSKCVCIQNFQFSWWSRDHFSASFRGLYLLNAWPHVFLGTSTWCPSFSCDPLQGHRKWQRPIGYLWLPIGDP